MLIYVGIGLLALSGLFGAIMFLNSKPRTTTFKRTATTRASTITSSTQTRQTGARQFTAKKKKQPLTFKEKLFRAGIISNIELKKFYIIYTISPLSGFLIMFLLGLYLQGLALANIFGIFGAVLGFLYPFHYLRKRMKQREEEISYYLPVVIEQLAIGVASGLDIGPCIQLVLDLSDERQTNNAVTELLKLAVQISRQGIPFDEALLEIGKLSGNVELKHCFLALGQVYKHGGEISKQLMEIAISVNQQRQIKIDERIKKLPVKGVLIVGLLLAGFMTLILYGLGMTVAAQLKGVVASEDRR